MKKTKLLAGKSKFLEGKVKVIGKAKTLEMSKSHAIEMYKSKHLALGKSKELASLHKLKSKY